MSKKNTCIQLRRKGKSFREIAKVENIPLSTVFLWTKTVAISDEQKRYLYEKSMKKLHESRAKAQDSKKKKYQSRLALNLSLGRKIVGRISKQNIAHIGAALYWGEGFKKDSRLGFANSDPDMIRFFVYWLINEMGVSKEKIRLNVGINITFFDKVREIEKYWSEIVNIPLSQFQKPFCQKTKTKRIYPNKNEYHGVLRVRAIGQNDVFRKILGMVDQLKKESSNLSIKQG